MRCFFFSTSTFFDLYQKLLHQNPSTFPPTGPARVARGRGRGAPAAPRAHRVADQTPAGKEEEKKRKKGEREREVELLFSLSRFLAHVLFPLQFLKQKTKTVRGEHPEADSGQGQGQGDQRRRWRRRRRRRSSTVRGRERERGKRQRTTLSLSRSTFPFLRFPSYPPSLLPPFVSYLAPRACTCEKEKNEKLDEKEGKKTLLSSLLVLLLFLPLLFTTLPLSLLRLVCSRFSVRARPESPL